MKDTLLGIAVAFFDWGWLWFLIGAAAVALAELILYVAGELGDG